MADLRHTRYSLKRLLVQGEGQAAVPPSQFESGQGQGRKSTDRDHLLAPGALVSAAFGAYAREEILWSE